MALVVTLAHMGLPVPAERARIEHVTALHYHAKTQGTLDAGAFEATLRQFGSLVGDVRGGDAAEPDGESDDPDGATNEVLANGGRGGVLVLVDELESITEPGASAKIMAGILEAFADTDATEVFVTHLAREIRESAAADLAVDGIEAEGLIDGELRVERSPVKGKLARSTPELIVEKLADEREGFYDELLGKFE